MHLTFYRILRLMKNAPLNIAVSNTFQSSFKSPNNNLQWQLYWAIFLDTTGANLSLPYRQYSSYDCITKTFEPLLKARLTQKYMAAVT